MAGNAEKGEHEAEMKQKMDGLTQTLGEAWDKLGIEPEVVEPKQEDPKQVAKPAETPENVVKPEKDTEIPPEQSKPPTEAPTTIQDDSDDEDPLSVLKMEDEPTLDPHTRADDDDAKAELDEIRNDPHANPRTKRSMERLLGKISAQKKVLGTQEKELATLKQEIEALKAQKPESDPVTDAEKEELKMLRRRVAVESDPEITGKYDTRIGAINETLNAIVDSSFNPEDAAKIKQMGFETFAKSLPREYKKLIEKLDEDSPYDAETVRASLGELRSLSTQRKHDIEKLSQESDKYWAEKQKVAQESEQQVQKRTEAIKQIRAALEDELINRDKYFMTIDTSKLSGEEKERAEKENKRRAYYQKNIRERIHAATLEEQQKTIYQAAMLPVIANMLKDERAELKRVKTELDSIKKKQTLTAPKTEPKPEAPKKPKGFEDAINEMAGLAGMSNRVVPN